MIFKIQNSKICFAVQILIQIKSQTRHMMTRSQILYSPKSISQSQIENSVKAMKTISLYIKNGLVLQNDGLGIHSDKI